MHTAGSHVLHKSVSHSSSSTFFCCSTVAPCRASTEACGALGRPMVGPMETFIGICAGDARVDLALWGTLPTSQMGLSLGQRWSLSLWRLASHGSCGSQAIRSTAQLKGSGSWLRLRNVKLPVAEKDQKVLLEEWRAVAWRSLLRSLQAVQLSVAEKDQKVLPVQRPHQQEPPEVSASSSQRCHDESLALELRNSMMAVESVLRNKSFAFALCASCHDS